MESFPWLLRKGSDFAKNLMNSQPRREMKRRLFAPYEMVEIFRSSVVCHAHCPQPIHKQNPGAQLTWPVKLPSLRVVGAAVAYSLAALVIVVGSVGLRWFAEERKRWSQRPLTKVVHCQIMDGSSELRALVVDCGRIELDSGCHYAVQCIGSDLTCNKPAMRLGSQQVGNSFTSDSRRGQLFFVLDDRGIGQLDLESGELNRSAELASQRAHSLAVTEDGMSLLVHTQDQLTCWNLPDSLKQNLSVRWRVQQPHIECFGLQPRSNIGALSCFVEGRNMVYQFAIDTGTMHPIAQVQGPPCRRLCFAATGRYLALIKDEGVLEMLRSVDASNWQAYDVVGMRTGTAHVGCFSPSGHLWITSDHSNQALAVWDIEERRQVASTAPLHWPLLGACWLNDRRYVAWGLSDKVLVFDITSPTPIKVIPCAL